MGRHLFPILWAIVFVGCAAPKPQIALNDLIPSKAGKSALTIISPQEQYLPGQALSSFTDYDYFLDCPDDRCKIGRMHMLQYITIYPDAGKHTLYSKLSHEGVTNTLAVANTDMIHIDLNSNTDQNTFIYHGWQLSLGSLIGPFAAQSSQFIEIDSAAATERLQKVSDTTSIFGEKMSGFGEKGTVYKK